MTDEPLHEKPKPTHGLRKINQTPHERNEEDAVQAYDDVAEEQYYFIKDLLKK